MRREHVEPPKGAIEETAFQIVDVRPEDIPLPSPEMQQLIAANQQVLNDSGIDMDDLVRRVRERFSTIK